MTDYKLVPNSIVDELAQFIRMVDGNHNMGAGSLAEKICERFRVDTPAVQGEPGVKWAPEEVANGNKGIRWVSDEGVHGRPTDHDCRVYLESNPNARGCHCPECMLAEAPQPAEQQPDVTQLVEALETIQKAATHKSIHTGIQAGTALGCIAAICDIALASYRKGTES